MKNSGYVDLPSDIQLNPVPIKFGDLGVLIKIDAIFHAGGVLAIGGWASIPLKMAMEANGLYTPFLHAAPVFRQDVNAYLQFNDDKLRGFALVGVLKPDEKIFLLAEDETGQLRLRIPLDMSIAVSELTERYAGVFGRAIYYMLEKLVRQGIAAYRRKLIWGIDYAFKLEDSYVGSMLAVSGWIVMPPGGEFVFKNSFGHKQVVKPYFMPRGDIARQFGDCLNHGQNGHGFFIAFPVAGGESSSSIYIIYKNTEFEIPLSDVDVSTSYKNFLLKIFSIPVSHTELIECYEKSLLPVLREFQKKHLNHLQSMSIIEESIGAIPDNPETSIIISLYKSIKLLDFQIMCFSEDVELRKNSELIYVIDDLSLLEDFKKRISELSRLYDIPVRWAHAHCNQGFSGANNLGAKVARGRHLIFMNNDVFPDKPGWVKQFCKYLDENPDAGIIGCRLLFGHGGIQHAGMQFLYDDVFKTWLNIHPFKYCDAANDPLSEPANVPAVTGACMAMRKADFMAVKGWSMDYLIGDFEDSDLCLKMRALGRKIIYFPHITMTHLERQSFCHIADGDIRLRLQLCNAAIHHNKWKRMLSDPTAWEDCSVTDDSDWQEIVIAD